jgi:putative FmdB family regulatory protein
MPIYEYRCGKCGFQKEYLQRLNETPLTKCPECGKRTFTKMVTAAGFHLKGTGWYATDFKDSGSGKAKPKEKAAESSAKDGSSKEGSSKEGSSKEAPAKESPAKESPAKESSKTKSDSESKSKSGAGAGAATS